MKSLLRRIMNCTQFSLQNESGCKLSLNTIGETLTSL
ncbi:hypothetical protein [Pseudomonas phage PhL_UNISO_PA-DSM_ph0034]|uniref:Uncharacterized protein n=1 Tax=Pseudomonas phage PhL_UNISO_PA-DSM_ph0034 TaxID=2812900 RepID=A0A9E6Q9T7_9CAUD|nr:hypothetical protein QE329_gp096 [Pseudomonas phage PhL_UNISO_PA-DSM_ph0034]QYC95216.1 hypothetical protein [Pseudomonas phage PhL_UNISO_PA-DSM_ph0034]